MITFEVRGEKGGKSGTLSIEAPSLRNALERVANGGIENAEIFSAYVKLGDARCDVIWDYYDPEANRNYVYKGKDAHVARLHLSKQANKSVTIKDIIVSEITKTTIDETIWPSLAGLIGITIVIGIPCCGIWWYNDYNSRERQLERMDQRRIAEWAEEERLERDGADISVQFSAWDGSHFNLVKHVKTQLHDPGSFEHIETRQGRSGENTVVVMTYRAKNGFGALRRSTARAIIDRRGNATYYLE